LLVLIALESLLTSCDRVRATPTDTVPFIPTGPPYCAALGDAGARITLSLPRAVAGERFFGSIAGAHPHELLEIGLFSRSTDHPQIASRSAVRVDRVMRADEPGTASFTVRSYTPGRYALRIEGECGTDAQVTFRTLPVAPKDFETAARGTHRGRTWTLALSDEACDAVGVSFAYRGAVESACVATPDPQAQLQPVAFLDGTVVAFASEDIARAKWRSFQARSVPAQVLTLHSDTVSVPRVVLVFGTAGADGNLVGFDGEGRERASTYVGLPPGCAFPQSQTCLADQ
jgi:hypothetical protein